MNNFLLIFFIIVISYIWLETNACIEYSKLLKLDFIYKKYEEHCQKFPSMKSTYQDYLLFTHNNYFTRLLTCSDCLIVVLNLLALPLSKGSWQMLGFSITISWLIFYLLKIVKRKAHE